jgi:putative SOS response-associated peptidase YedK
MGESLNMLANALTTSQQEALGGLLGAAELHEMVYMARDARDAEGTERGEHLLYGFLTTAANGVIAPVHAKAMPVILRTVEECDAWLTAEPAEALKMQRPLADDALKIVARGEKEDPPPSPAPREEKPAVVPELPL